MLQKLIIKNYALIDSLELDFDKGLTIVTGETGAGKSIMLGALSLLLGDRADSKAISDGSSKSVVEAVFTDVDDSLKKYFEENDIEWMDGEAIVRREISQTGRSRAFVNDRPVTLNVLSGLTGSLIDIHSQHANARLNDSSTQLEIIDTIACNSGFVNSYASDFHSFVALRSRIRLLRENIGKARENEEYLRFQLGQLDKLNPKAGELAEVERRFEMLSDADEIRERLFVLSGLLGAQDRGVADLLREAKSEAEKIDFSLFDSSEEENEDIVSRLERMVVEATDIYETVSDYVSSVDADPAALSKMSARMNAYYEAIRSFRVSDADELVRLRDEVRAKLNSIEDEGTDLPELEKKAKQLASLLKEKAARISETRKEAAKRFSQELMETARPLGLPNMDFKVDVVAGKLSSTGQDRVEFLCSFNKQQSPGPVSKIASGGEFSRLMLSMKGILAGRMKLPTIIFDEVDTGVSGEIADLMGEMMLSMGARMQVIAITHLPQVAAKGASHFKVYKRDEAQRTITNVRKLGHEERVREIASMMSGREVTDAALKNAENLLGLYRPDNGKKE